MNQLLSHPSCDMDEIGCRAVPCIFPQGVSIMKRGKEEPHQAACRTSGMRTIVSPTMDEPPVHARANSPATGMVIKALSRKGEH